MAFNEFPIPTQKLSEATTVSSLDIGEFVIVSTPDGIRRVSKGNVGFARFFIQSSEPTGATTQDIWIDTGSGNSIKVWDGASWVARNFSTSAGSIPLGALEDIDTQRILGRITADSGEVETLTAAQLRTIINVADGANNYSHPNHTGDVTSDGDGAQTIGNDVVTNAKAANMPAETIKGNPTGSPADPQDMTPSAVRSLLGVQQTPQAAALSLRGNPTGSTSFPSDIEVGQFGIDLVNAGDADTAKQVLEIPDLTYVPEIVSLGDSSSTNTQIRIRLLDLEMNPVQRRQILRVRLCAEGGYVPKSGNDEISATGGTTLLSLIYEPEVEQDIVIESDENGLFEIELNHSDTSTSTIRLGAAPLGSENANYTQTLNVTPSDAS